MFIARDSNNKRIYIDEANEAIQYYCPICGEEVIQRRGKTNVHHFAHKKNSECDSWKYDMSEWHKNWQSMFPVDNREVVIVHNGEKHRADILIGNTVIEFQHSRMSNEEFKKRTNFYFNAGYNLVWLFDLTEEYQSGKISLYNREYTYKWSHHWHIFDDFIPNNTKVKVYLQFSSDLSEGDCGIEHLTWLSEDSKYFSTERYVAYDRAEFIKLFIPEGKDNSEEKGSATDHFTVADIQDALISVNGYYFACPRREGKRVCFENCDCCEYSTMCVSNDSIGISFRDLYLKRPDKIHAAYVSGCLYRFKDIIENWDLDKDKVLDIKYNTDFRITNITYEKQGEVIVKDYSKPNNVFVVKTLLELLRETNSDVIVARNIESGARVKVRNSSFYKTHVPTSIEGCLGKENSYTFYKDRRPIYYWEKKKWIKEWEPNMS